MFCKHEFEFSNSAIVPTGYLWLDNSYNYVFICRKCGKIKYVPISFNQYYETSSTVVVLPATRKADDLGKPIKFER